MSEPSRELIGTTMSCRHLGDLVIVVHDERLAPSDAEWERYVRWCKALLMQHSALKVLAIAGQAPPSAQQRSLYNGEIPGDRVRIAVLVSGRPVLVIVKIFAWFVRNIEGFERNDLPGALGYLGVAPSPEITAAIRELGASVKGMTVTAR